MGWVVSRNLGVPGPNPVGSKDSRRLARGIKGVTSAGQTSGVALSDSYLTPTPILTNSWLARDPTRRQVLLCFQIIDHLQH